MPSPSWEDLDVFLDVDDFATPASIEFQAGGTVTVNGIFSDPFMNAQLGEFDLNTSEPRLLCKESEVLAVRRGDRVTIDGKVYDVLNGPQATGDGMANLALALAP